ncbi:MAG: LysR family transcriptional regulator [Lachnospiraceae bacterium]|nr:LysR family transcriptional regulator [Lachnospiraceae bacterium]
MDLRQLHYFSVSARCGSFTKAAEELYTTQPHVSMMIRSLERELETKLFTRGADGIRLTDTGEQVLYYAENALKTTDMIRSACRTFNDRYLRIAANPSSSLAFMAGDFFLQYMEQGIDLQYMECSSEEMSELLIGRQYDIGFLFIPSDKIAAYAHRARRSHLTWHPIRTADLVIHSGPESPFYGKASAKPEDLDGCAFIQFEDDYFSTEDLLMHSPVFQSGRARIRKVVTTNSDHMMIRMLQTTDLCNIGSYWTESMYGKYSFSMTRIEGFENSITFGYLVPDNKSLRPEAEAFLRIIIDAAGGSTLKADAGTGQAGDDSPSL